MPARKQLNFWTAKGRGVVFLLAATSIACLLFDFYQLCPMRTFTFFVFVPALMALFAMAVADRFWGNQQLWRGVRLGIRAGFIAAIAYDIFRLPFVFAKPLGLDVFFPALNLFKVFPRFGAMILGQPIEQATYSLTAHVVGWIYHFSNGITFGVMYVAMVNCPSRRTWAWGVLMALVLELGMLVTPYPGFFNIPISVAFILATLAAHTIFGMAMGVVVQRCSSKLSSAAI
ncbi:MAG: DUF6789 family protein [Verrucomicrobiota bacterium]